MNAPIKSFINSSVKAIQAVDVASLLQSPTKLFAAPPVDKSDMPRVELSPASAKFVEVKMEFKSFEPKFVESMNDMSNTSEKELFEALHNDLASIMQYLTKTLQNWNVLENLVQQATFVSAKLTDLKQSIDKNHHLGFPTVLSAVEDIYSNIDGVDFDHLTDSVNQNTFNISLIELEYKNHSPYWEALTQNWLPCIQLLETSLSNLKSKCNDHSQNHKSSTQNHQNLNSILQQNTNVQQSVSGNTSITDLEQLVKHLEGKVQQLEAKQNAVPPTPQSFSASQPSLSMAGVCYRQYYFKDPDDLESWMRTNMSHTGHGLFVDLVSFSEFFGVECYIEHNTMLNEVYIPSKIGHATIADSIVVSSFQNVLPAAYGMPLSSSKSNEQDLTAQAELPGIPSFSKWDNRDGRNGRQYWI